MQRQKSSIYLKAKTIYPRWLWHECRFCNKEFKRENGFKIIDYKKSRAVNEDPLFTSYCCNKCANSIEEVIEKIKKQDIRIILKNYKRSCE